MTDRRLFWTDEQIQRLRELCTKPISNRQIANTINEEYQTHYSRNAIIGKRMRLGIIPTAPKGAHTRAGRPKKPKPNGNEMKEIVINHGTYFKVVNRRVPELPISEDDLPKEHRCTLMDLNNHSCRWPYGDSREGKIEFCGIPEANMIQGHPYCPTHARMAVGE